MTRSPGLPTKEADSATARGDMLTIRQGNSQRSPFGLRLFANTYRPSMLTVTRTLFRRSGDQAAPREGSINVVGMAYPGLQKSMADVVCTPCAFKESYAEALTAS